MTEERWVRAHDGWRLSVLDVAAVGAPVGVAVVGHAMMVDRSSVHRTDRPSLATTLAHEGFRVLVPDLRGHGASGPCAGEGGTWRYDDVVDDVGIYLDLASKLEPERPIALVGNSLFGHAALARLGMRGGRVDAMALFAVNIWNRRWTPSEWRWALKRSLIASAAVTLRALGYLPVRRLGLGTDDEPASYWTSMLRWVAGDVWDSDDGLDYASGLAQVGRPVLQVVSEGDRLLCHPDDGIAFGAALPRREVIRLGRASGVRGLEALSPGHVEMVASPRCEPLWRHVARWLKSSISS